MPSFSDNVGAWVSWAVFGTIGLLGALASWLTNRQVDSWDAKHKEHERRHEEHSSRLRMLEVTSATKDDVGAVYDRVNEVGDQLTRRIDDMGATMTAQHDLGLRLAPSRLATW